MPKLIQIACAIVVTASAHVATADLLVQIDGNSYEFGSAASVVGAHTSKRNVPTQKVTINATEDPAQQATRIVSTSPRAIEDDRKELLVKMSDLDRRNGEALSKVNAAVRDIENARDRSYEKVSYLQDREWKLWTGLLVSIAALFGALIALCGLVIKWREFKLDAEHKKELIEAQRRANEQARSDSILSMPTRKSEEIRSPLPAPDA